MTFQITLNYTDDTEEDFTVEAKSASDALLTARSKAAMNDHFATSFVMSGAFQ